MVAELTSVSAAGAYEDLGVVVVGFRFSVDDPLECIVLQIAGPEFDVPDARPEDFAISIDINDQAASRSGAVRDFVFDRARGRVCFRLDHPDFPEISAIRIDIPDSMSAEEKSLIEKMATLAGSAAR